MKRLHLNFVTDAVAFGTFLFLISTGVLLRYQLPPGSGGLGGRGIGRGEGQQSVATLWGWTRHQWGEIHYWIACGLMAVLAIHLILHWKWVVCVVRGKSSDASGWRLALGAVGLAAVVLLAAAPWISPVAERTREQLRQESALPAASAEPSDAERGSRIPAPDSRTWLRGFMSLEEIANRSGISVDYLIDEVGLPDDAPTTVHVGQLLRSHGLQMSDLRRIVEQDHNPLEAARAREALR